LVSLRARCIVHFTMGQRFDRGLRIKDALSAGRTCFCTHQSEKEKSQSPQYFIVD